MLKGNIGCEETLLYFSKVIQGQPSQNFSMLRKQGSELFIPLEKEHLHKDPVTREWTLEWGGAQPWSSRVYVYQMIYWDHHFLQARVSVIWKSYWRKVCGFYFWCINHIQARRKEI